MSSSDLPSGVFSAGSTGVAVSALEGGLANAAAKVRSARVRVARGEGWERASMLLAATAGVGAVAIVVSRLSGASAGWVWGLAGVGVVAAGAVMASAIYPAWSATPSLDEVAERLDLANADKNRIATALNLARGSERSPFIACAISDGLGAVKTLGASEPVVPSRSTSGKRTWGLVGGGAVLVALALLVPLRKIVPGGGDDARPAVALAKPVALGMENRPPRKPEEKRPQAETPDPGMRSPLESAPNPSGTKQNSQSDSSASAAMSSSAAGAAPESTAAASASAKEKQEPQAEQPKNQAPAQGAAATPNPSNKAPKLGDSGKTSADSRSKAGNFQGGTRADQVPTAANQQDSSANENTGENSSPGSPPPSSESEEGGSGNGPGEKGKGQGSGTSDSSNEGEGGDGQSSGQNAPKKSRGVAPLMLGTREPDLFQGRQLAGPDERTKLQVPPRQSPGQPQPDAGAAQRTGDEQVVPNYRVPASMQRLVSDYFQKYHTDGKGAESKPAAGSESPVGTGGK